MNPVKIKSLLSQIKTAHKVRMVLQGREIDLSVSISFNRTSEAPLNHVMFAYWHDDNGFEHTYIFNEAGLDNTAIVNESLVMKDVDGNEIILKLYTTPTLITPLINW